MQTTLLFCCAGSLVKMSHTLIDGYEKAYNDNIPLVDVVMMGLFLGNGLIKMANAFEKFLLLDLH